MFVRLLGALFFYNFASIGYAVTTCDQLAALEADPLSASEPVKFADLKADKGNCQMHRSDPHQWE